MALSCKQFYISDITVHLAVATYISYKASTVIDISETAIKYLIIFQHSVWSKRDLNKLHSSLL